MKLLIVEDDEMLLKVMQRALEKVGYQVRTATGVESGLQRAISDSPDVILSDYYLPDGTGLDLIEQLNQRPRTTHIRHLLMSFYPEVYPALSIRPYNLEGFLLKPFTLSELVRFLNYFRSKPIKTQPLTA
jgi:CheY-like chemotaxis protein